MAVGKNKRLGKKKGQKKKIVDPFLRKEWYTIQAPSMFQQRNCGWTCVTRTMGKKIASEELKGRVYEVNLADTYHDEKEGEDQGHRKIKLCAEEVQGKTVLTNFHGMDLTRDKLCSLIKKWQTLIEAHTEIRTTDGYTMRLFCIGFTKKRQLQQKKTCYAQSAQIRSIRRKMVEVMQTEASKCDLRELVVKFIPELIGKEIEKHTASIFPLQNVFIRKVKVIKKPKFDLTKLMELHETTTEDKGVAVERPAETEAAPVVADE